MTLLLSLVKCFNTENSSKNDKNTYTYHPNFTNFHPFSGLLSALFLRNLFPILYYFKQGYNKHSNNKKRLYLSSTYSVPGTTVTTTCELIHSQREDILFPLYRWVTHFPQIKGPRNGGTGIGI